jgi:hypothetical protein
MKVYTQTNKTHCVVLKKLQIKKYSMKSIADQLIASKLIYPESICHVIYNVNIVQMLNYRNNFLSH